MTLVNFLIGLPMTLLCLIVQVARGLLVRALLRESIVGGR